MESQHETMCAEMEGVLDEVRSRRVNHMGSLRLRGRTYWARWHYIGQSYGRSTGAKIDERRPPPRATRTPLLFRLQNLLRLCGDLQILPLPIFKSPIAYPAVFSRTIPVINDDCRVKIMWPSLIRERRYSTTSDKKRCDIDVVCDSNQKSLALDIQIEKPSFHFVCSLCEWAIAFLFTT